MTRQAMNSTSKKTPSTSKPRSAKNKKLTPIDRSEAIDREDPDRGAPIEHYRGEPDRGLRTGNPGSLEEETLDADAPYNRTYGRLPRLPAK